MDNDIYNLPAGSPPNGEVQNLVNPPNLFWPTTILGYSFLLITLSFFAIRMYTNGFLLKKMQWDDYTCIIAVMLFIPFDSLLVYSVYHGAGVHIWDMTIGTAFFVAHIASAVENLYCMAHLFAKISLLQQIRRIFSGTKKKGLVYVSCTVCLWGNVLFYVATMAAHIGGCQPSEYEWNKLVTGHCINIEMLVVVSSAINVFTDLTIFIIPIYAVWRLVMPTRRKIAIGVIFATGALSFLFSIVRLYFTVPLLWTDDLLWQLLLSGLWTIPEISTAIICGCMPSIPLFVRSFRDKERSEKPTTSISYGPGSEKRKAPPNTRRLHLSNWSKHSTQREKIPVEPPPMPKIDPELGLTSTISAVPRAMIRHSSEETGSTFVELDQGGSPRPSTSGTMNKIMNPAITVTTTTSQPMSPSQLALIANDGAGVRTSQRTMDTPITLHPDDGTLPPTSPSVESELAGRNPFSTPTDTDRAMSVSPDHGTSISSAGRSLASPDLISPLVSRSSSTRIDAKRRRRAEQRAARLARGNAVEMEDTSVPSTHVGASSSEVVVSTGGSGLGVSNSELERSKSAPARPKLMSVRSKYAPKTAKYQPGQSKDSSTAEETLGVNDEPPRANSAPAVTAIPPAEQATLSEKEEDEIRASGKARAVDDDAATHSSASAPPTPLSKRPPSLSERTTSTAGRQAMQSLRGRFWRDSIDENRDAEERALATWRTVQRNERNAREQQYTRLEAEREARALRLMLH